MAIKSRSRRQAKSDRAAIRKLKSAGLYTGKADLRKKPTRYQRRLIEKFADVIKGRAKVLRPANPKTYRQQFRVVGDKVIVPKRKGERVRVTKEGKIGVKRRVGRRVLSGEYEPVAGLPNGAGIYFLPLQHGGGVEWHRFSSRDDLLKFVFETSPKIGETFKHFGNYVLRLAPGTVDRLEDEGELDDALEERLYQRLARRRRSRRRRK